MSPCPEGRRWAVRVAFTLVALGVVAGGFWRFRPAARLEHEAASPASTTRQSVPHHPIGTDLATSIPPSPRPPQTPPAPETPALEAQIAQLAALPPSDDAITLGHRLLATATPETASVWRDALLHAQHPAVERIAIAALARTADSAVVQDLARAYTSMPAEQRGRVLQVLETADNPAALEGLVRTVATDRGERRSALAVSALYGMASLGTVAAIDHLLQQAATDDVDFALMALERVRTRQAVEQIRAAADGSKDHTRLSASVRGHLRRIASTAEARLADR